MKTRSTSFFKDEKTDLPYLEAKVAQLQHRNKEQYTLYNNCSLDISTLELEPESAAYDACRFELNGQHIICRSAKITPKKAGQFVTFWKRSGNGPIEPFSETERFDFFVVNVRAENKLGQFVFPKSVLIEKGLVSTTGKEGKRAFRVYPPWDTVLNKQAAHTQQWQLTYFYEIGEMTDFNKVKALYGKN